MTQFSLGGFLIEKSVKGIIYGYKDSKIAKLKNMEIVSGGDLTISDFDSLGYPNETPNIVSLSLS